MLGFLFRGLTAEGSSGAALFGALTAEARKPHWYVEGKVPDTLDGRFAVLATLVAVPLKANQSQGHEGRKDRKAAVERVRNLALDVPVRLPRLRRQCSEQGRGARAFGR